MEFIDFLLKHHSKGTAKRYEKEVLSFLFSVDKKTVDYQRVMDYLAEQRARGKQATSVSLAAIKRYFDYEIFKGKRTDHPAKTIHLKDKVSKDIQLQDLFTSAELESLLERKERYVLLKNRNQIIIGLLIYQALTKAELCSLLVSDINLESGSIKIKGSRKINARTLKLKPKQLYVLKSYLTEDRPKLVRDETDYLLIGKLGKAEMGEGITYLIETARKEFYPRELNLRTIRQSVISNLLKDGHDLRIVQAFAGHKYPSTTERYRQTGIEQLQTAIERHHPLR